MKINKKTRNDIINNSAGGDLGQIITIDSLKGSIPYIIMHCPKLPANKDQDKFKGMKMTFVDPSNPTRSFTAENCTFSVQGTSSAGYPVKNFKIKLDKTKGIKYTRNGQVDLDGFYFEGKDEAFKESVMNKAKVVGYARALRRTIKRMPDQKELIEHYRNQLIKYVDQTDTLLF